MSTLIDEPSPRFSVLSSSEARHLLQKLQDESGSYDDLCAKAELDALSPDERVILRKIERLMFLLEPSL